MIKKIVALFITISLLFTVSACDLIGGQLDVPEIKFIEADGLIYWSPVIGAYGYTVRFDYKEEGVEDENGMKVVTMPTLAVFEENYVSVKFLGVGVHTAEVSAVSDSYFKSNSDWSEPLEFTVYEEDSVAVNSFIGVKMSCNVEVYTEGYKVTGMFMPIKTKEVAYQGSGVIYKHEKGEYYLLTNYHVIECDSDLVEYSISDYQGKSYSATLVGGLSDYDLAVLKFTASGEYNTAEFASSNPKEGGKVISLGQPKGQKNALSLGKVLCYVNVNSSDGNNIEFEVLGHSSPVNSGSSGGALFDYSYKLVGVNFAVAKDESIAYAIPIEKVVEFLSLI